MMINNEIQINLHMHGHIYAVHIVERPIYMGRYVYIGYTFLCHHHNQTIIYETSAVYTRILPRVCFVCFHVQIRDVYCEHVVWGRYRKLIRIIYMVLTDSIPNKYICENYVHMNMTIFMGIGSSVFRYCIIFISYIWT